MREAGNPSPGHSVAGLGLPQEVARDAAGQQLHGKRNTSFTKTAITFLYLVAGLLRDMQ